MLTFIFTGHVDTTFGSNEQLPFSATPGPSMKNPRKRLNLFSPASGRKSKRSVILLI